MWPLIFVGTFMCASVSGNAGIGSVFCKCCPKSQSLVKVSDFYVKSEIYKCLPREEVKKQSIKIDNAVSEDYGIPKLCEEKKNIQLSSEESSIGNESCHGKLVAELVNGSTQQNFPRVVAFTCIRNETENLTETLTIEQMRKCCPKGQSYDTKNHICRVTDEGSIEEWVIRNILKNVSSDFIYEVAYGLHCKYVGVELSEKMFYLNLQGSSLNSLKKNGKSGGVAFQGEWCIDREYGKSGLVARVCTHDCSSYGAFCLRKCCPVGQYYRGCNIRDSKCVPNNEEIPFNASVYIGDLKGLVDTDVLGIRTADLRCPEGLEMWLNQSRKQDHHRMTPQGTLNSTVANDDRYCFEMVDSRHCPGAIVASTTRVCFVGSTTNNNFRITAVINTISSVCLAMTLIVYVSLPELRNLHGKMLICHASMMLVAFSCLARAQYRGVQSDRMCTVLGYGIYFGFTAAFAWLNVMCVDLWSSVRSMRTVQQIMKNADEWRRFLWYSLYAWSVALVLTVTLFLLNRFPVAAFLDGNIGNGKCWFGNVDNSKIDWPRYIFFVIPMGLFTCTNFVLFMLTARYCARVKSEVHRLQAGSEGDRAKRRFRIDRAKYILTAKLWVVMGAGWVAELLSTFFSKPEWLWAIVDLINQLQGVFIFLVLIYKPKLFYYIRRRLRLNAPDVQEPRTLSTFMTFVFTTIRRKRWNRQIEDVTHSKRNSI